MLFHFGILLLAMETYQQDHDAIIPFPGHGGIGNIGSTHISHHVDCSMAFSFAQLQDQNIYVENDRHFRTSNVWPHDGLISSILVIGFGLAIDFLFYGRWLFTWYNFFMVNLGEGISSYYGTLPFLWYFFGAIPILLGPLLPFFIWSCIYSGSSSLLICIFPFVSILSLVSHKELRFLYPIFPMMNTITGIGIYHFYHTTKISQQTKNALLAILFIIAAIISVLYCRGFSTAGIEMTDYLHRHIGNRSVLFLFSHAAPLYAGVLRAEAKLDYVHMEPPFLKNFTHINNRYDGHLTGD